MADLSESDRAELGNIGFHWDEAYVLDHNGEVFTATRMGSPGHVLTAETPRELRSAIRSDYFAWLATLKERAST